MAEEKDNIVYVGKKEVNSYILAVLTQAKQNKRVFIKARGRSISKAVDVSQRALRHLTDWKLDGVEIGTDVWKLENGDEKNISSIEIGLCC